MSCAKCGMELVAINQDDKPLNICPSCDIPDRTCTWCKLLMRKKLVGNGGYVHYICPKCVFQHTSKYTATPAATLPEP